MSGQDRVILDQDGLKVRRLVVDEDLKGACEHRLTREGGFGDKLRAACNAVQALAGVTHAYTSPRLDGGTIFYGLETDEPERYLPVARKVAQAVKAAL